MNTCLLEGCETPTKSKFCSRSHAATYNNKQKPKRQVGGSCAVCGTPISKSRKYCSKVCQYSGDLTKCHCGAPRLPYGNLCREHYNEKMAAYMTARYHRRRTEFIESRGSECVQCGSKGHLEIDHKDYLDKEFDIGKALSGWSEERVKKELAKCQVLCYDCHKKKTRKDLADRFGQREYWEHGTISGYRYCRCDECKKAMSAWNREYRQKRSRI